MPTPSRQILTLQLVLCRGCSEAIEDPSPGQEYCGECKNSSKGPGDLAIGRMLEEEWRSSVHLRSRRSTVDSEGDETDPTFDQALGMIEDWPAIEEA